MLDDLLEQKNTSPFVVLATGNQLSVLGVPQRVDSIAADAATTSQVIADCVDRKPAEVTRIIGLGYELGATCVHLPLHTPPRQQPYGFVLDFKNSTPHNLPVRPVISGGVRFDTTVSDAEHARRIHHVKEHIAAGDIYQANIARRLLLEGDFDGLTAFIALTQHNPVAHGAYVSLPNVTLVSNSMETLLTYDPATRLAQSLPIKGTCARGSTTDLDIEAQQRLLADSKERAEHVMIVDLVRNDLGKLAVAGSVQVPHFMAAKAYRGVWHGVSTVSATLAPQYTSGQLLAALFPGGSITGAPKRRAMQIIEDVEQEPRGFYTGSLAIIEPDGKMSVSILIRTLVRDAGGWSLHVGGGIVADSTPEREIEETWEKARVFRDVLEGRR